MTKKLFKSRNRILCGVCGGVADYFSIDPTIVRLAFIFLAICGVGSGIVAYIIAAIVVPDEPDTFKDARTGEEIHPDTK